MKNIYYQFIDYLKKQESKLNLKENNLEKHHILPLHAGGKKDGNIVLCTSKNHTLAHYYRYLAFRQKGDLVAFKMRWNQKVGLKERSLLAVEKNKKLKQLFWDPNWQSTQGKKGGAVSGQKNALLYCQSYIMRETIRNFTYWEFTYNNQDDKNKFLNNKSLIKDNNIFIHEYNNKFIVLKMKPQKTFTQLTNILNKTNLCLIKDVSSFSKIARGKRKKYYNWQLVAVEINWDLI
uniref:HNH endonuclease n=1 Tax=Ulva intestinalis TaxID=3116 RepID=A0A8F4XLD8_ULVIN|nr:hypothetical protein [Ulva intestinalis]